jgi:flagellin
MSLSSRKLEKSMIQLSSGDKFAGVKDTAADFAIAERLRSQIHGMEAAKNNADNAVNFVQVAEGGLNEQNNLLIRMRELSVQAASDTYSDDERKLINHEFQQLSQEVDRIAQTTTYGSKKLLVGNSDTLKFQVGPNSGDENTVTYDASTNTTASELDVKGLDVKDKTSASDSIKTIDGAINKISTARSSYGAIQSRFDSIVNYTSDQVVALQDAHSKMADTDVAKTYSEVVKQQALQQYQIAALSAANKWPGDAIRLVA